MAMNQYKNYIVAIFARDSSNNNLTTYYILNKVTLTVSYKNVLIVLVLVFMKYKLYSWNDNI